MRGARGEGDGGFGHELSALTHLHQKNRRFQSHEAHEIQSHETHKTESHEAQEIHFTFKRRLAQEIPCTPAHGATHGMRAGSCAESKIAQYPKST